jgi:hypothetical protein
MVLNRLSWSWSFAGQHLRNSLAKLFQGPFASLAYDNAWRLNWPGVEPHITPGGSKELTGDILGFICSQIDHNGRHKFGSINPRPLFRETPGNGTGE